MYSACVTYTDKKTKEAVQEKSLNCHRCWMSVPMTGDIEAIYEGLREGIGVETVTLSKRAAGFELPASIRADLARVDIPDYQPNIPNIPTAEPTSTPSSAATYIA